jgi:5'-phosphate synthase pdxT subunit
VNPPVIGVLALQGAFNAHQRSLESIGAVTREVKLPRDLVGLDGLVMPGGESTTMSQLLLSSGLFTEIAQLLSSGFPVMGTCAGLILLSSTVLDARPDQQSFGALNIEVRRNGYGRQIDSFETDLDVTGLLEPLTAVFIRAPIIESVGQGVTVVAAYNDMPVAVANSHILGAAFHPELVHDPRFHQLFLDMISRSTYVRPF